MVDMRVPRGGFGRLVGRLVGRGGVGRWSVVGGGGGAVRVDWGAVGADREILVYGIKI